MKSNKRIFAILTVLTLCNVAVAQTTEAKKPKANVMVTSGVATDFTSYGLMVDLTVFYAKDVFSIYYTSFETGSVITYHHSGFIFGGSTTSYPADAVSILTGNYGRRLLKEFAVTAGIAWVERTHNEAINGHYDSKTGDYSAQLVRTFTSYLGITAGIGLYLPIASWCGAELHLRAVAYKSGIMPLAALTMGFGNFDTGD